MTAFAAKKKASGVDVSLASRLSSLINLVQKQRRNGAFLVIREVPRYTVVEAISTSLPDLIW